MAANRSTRRAFRRQRAAGVLSLARRYWRDVVRVDVWTWPPAVSGGHIATGALDLRGYGADGRPKEA